MPATLDEGCTQLEVAQKRSASITSSSPCSYGELIELPVTQRLPQIADDFGAAGTVRGGVAQAVASAS
jgi:hypothetical protein